MRLLYVTEGTPNRDPRVGDGSSMISFEVLRALPPDVEITLLTYRDGAVIPAEVRRRCVSIETSALRGRRSSIVRSLVGGLSIGGAQRSTRAAQRAVARLSEAADVTLLHGPHVAHLASRVRGPLVVQVVDPWSLHVSMEAALTHGPRRRYRSYKAARAVLDERRLPASAILLTVGRGDAEAWAACLGRSVEAVGNGADRTTRIARTSGTPTVCFVGSLNYGPNIDSAIRLVEEVAPSVWSVEPATLFVLAGRRPTAAVLALAEDRVEVLADVPSVGAVFDAADVAVFCDRYGVGVRNSVREALAAGLPVVATSSAAREQPANQLLTVVDDPRDIVAAVLGHLRSHALAAPSRSAGVTESVRDWTAVATDYLDALRRAVDPGSSSTG